MKTTVDRRWIGCTPFALLVGCGVLVAGCSREERKAPEQRTEHVAPETLPVAPQVAPPIEQQDAMRAAQRERAGASQSEIARGVQPEPARERADVQKAEGTVGAERGHAVPCVEEQHAKKTAQRGGEHGARRSGERTMQRGGERGASGKDRGGAEAATGQVAAERGMTVEGRLFYGGPRLPEGSEILVALVGAESGNTISQKSIETRGDGPFTFELELPPGTTNASSFALRVTVEDDGGKVLYSTLQPYTPNLAEGSVLPVQIRME